MLLFFRDTATTEISTLSLHDALPISGEGRAGVEANAHAAGGAIVAQAPVVGKELVRRVLGGDPALQCVERSEEHTSELQSQFHLVCRLLLEKKKKMLRNVNNHAVYVQ